MDDEKRELPVAVTVNVNGVGAYPPPAPSVPHHEELIGLEGGDGGGHYHLTEEEYGYVTSLVDERKELEESGEERHTLSSDEHDKLIDIIEKIYPSEDEEGYVLSGNEHNKVTRLLEAVYPEGSGEPVFPSLSEAEVDAKIAAIEPGVTEAAVDAKIAAIDHEALTNLKGSSAEEHYHITSAEAGKLQKLITACFPNGAEEPVISSGCSGGGVTETRAAEIADAKVAELTTDKMSTSYHNLVGLMLSDGSFLEALHYRMKQAGLIS